MNKLFTPLVFISIILFACNFKEGDKLQETEVVISSKGCLIESLVIKSTKPSDEKIDTISKPTAITFFNLNNLLAKYDGKNIDSLPEKLRDPHRQEIYRTYDISGMYHAIVKPRLDSLNIKILDSVKTKGFLSFRLKDKSYIIDKAEYQEMDGVLLFNGKDKPIFWTAGVNCNPDDLLNCYFINKNCP